MSGRYVLWPSVRSRACAFAMSINIIFYQLIVASLVPRFLQYDGISIISIVVRIIVIIN